MSLTQVDCYEFYLLFSVESGVSTRLASGRKT